jgi:predicted nuclease of predicted toxin-antitoxin system
MKLLLDENLSRRIVPFILETYPNSSHVALIGLEQSDDKGIRHIQLFEMSMLFVQPPKIIWLRMGNQSKAEVIKVLQQSQDIIEQALFREDKACIEIL